MSNVTKAGAVAAVTAAFLGMLSFWESSGKPVLTPYRDVAGVWTVCDGITNSASPGFVVPGKRYTEQECTAEVQRLLEQRFMPGVAALVQRDIPSDAWLMLLDFAWNKGLGNLEKSTLLRKVNAGDCPGAAEEFSRWVYSGGQVYPGLVRRAKWNRYEFLKTCKHPVWGQSTRRVPTWQ